MSSSSTSSDSSLRLFQHHQRRFQAGNALSDASMNLDDMDGNRFSHLPAAAPRLEESLGAGALASVASAETTASTVSCPTDKVSIPRLVSEATDAERKREKQYQSGETQFEQAFRIIGIRSEQRRNAFSTHKVEARTAAGRGVVIGRFLPRILRSGCRLVHTHHHRWWKRK